MPDRSAPRRRASLAFTGIVALGLAVTVAVVGSASRLVNGTPDLYAIAERPASGVLQDDRSRLIGTWDLVDFSRQAKDGTITTPWGRRPVGHLTYDADGHVTALLMHEQRNEADGRPSSPEVQAEFSAYFGTYTVDPTRRAIIHHVIGSLSAERASGELRRNYAFKDGTLILTFTRTQDGAINSLVWKRVSQSNPLKPRGR
jgi:hypothetical protein